MITSRTIAEERVGVVPDPSLSPQHQVALEVKAIGDAICELRWAWIDHKNRDCIRSELQDLITYRDYLSLLIEHIEAPAIAEAAE